MGSCWKLGGLSPGRLTSLQSLAEPFPGHACFWPMLTSHPPSPVGFLTHSSWPWPPGAPRGHLSAEAPHN